MGCMGSKAEKAGGWLSGPVSKEVKNAKGGGWLSDPKPKPHVEKTASSPAPRMTAPTPAASTTATTTSKKSIEDETSKSDASKTTPLDLGHHSTAPTSSPRYRPLPSATTTEAPKTATSSYSYSPPTTTTGYTQARGPTYYSYGTGLYDASTQAVNDISDAISNASSY